MSLLIKFQLYTKVQNFIDRSVRRSLLEMNKDCGINPSYKVEAHLTRKKDNE